MKSDSSYIFASAFLRAKEYGSASERLNSVIHAQTTDSLCEAAAKMWGLSYEGSPEKLFERAITTAVESIGSCVPHKRLFYPLLYKYDCTNIKTIIKANILSISPENMLLNCGSISTDTLLEAFRRQRFHIVPQNMRNALADVTALYKKTGDAELIDIVLDQSAFKDMKADAEKSHSPLLMRIITAKSDSANLMTYIRLRKMDRLSLLSRSFIPTGSIPLSAFTEGSSPGSPEKLLHFIRNTSLRNTAEQYFQGNSTLAEIEKASYEAVLSEVQNVKYIAYGHEVAIRHLLVREAEVINCRIAYAALNGVFTKEKAQERMLLSYV